MPPRLIPGALLISAVLLALNVGCSSGDNEAGGGEASRSGAGRDSPASEPADTSWTGLLEDRPTYEWQAYFSEPRRLLLDDFDFVDAYRDGDTLRVLLFRLSGDMVAELACDLECERGLPALEPFGVYTFVAEVDAVRPTVTLPVWAEDDGGDLVVSLDYPDLVRTLSGRLLSAREM
ncbi:MAG TPA: hypothetical protein VK002_06655 [Rubricoccaceae bacterium]|nr:hypothetical protein [Rubricoccaceae bacterium]